MTNPVTPPPAAQTGGPVPPQGAFPAPGAVVPPAGPGQPQSGEFPAEKKSGIGKKVISILATIVVVVALRFAWSALFAETDNLADAKAGDCIDNAADVKDSKLVGCTDGAAAFKIAARVENVTEAQAKSDVSSGQLCAAAETATQTLWAKYGSKPGYLLCLEPVKK